MRTNHLIFYASRSPMWGDEVRLNIGHKRDDKTYVLEPPSFRYVEPGQIIDEPSLRMGLDEAQALMDTLWDAGVRPSQGQGSAGQLAAVKENLEDMRVIAGKLLDKVLNPQGGV